MPKKYKNIINIRRKRVPKRLGNEEKNVPKILEKLGENMYLYQKYQTMQKETCTKNTRKTRKKLVLKILEKLGINMENYCEICKKNLKL